ncbi:plectin-like isoform X8 [Gallus gallus]|uniref:plectin-like isoform X8 n=1 Tax=Gallus gallus TaxID=9031 RepID=UPI001AE71B9B|nr:plectin-like isoform X8 [Gallus gallus]XP_046791761.1 plectin-like isoform X8 [Gallus gallus]
MAEPCPVDVGPPSDGGDAVGGPGGAVGGPGDAVGGPGGAVGGPGGAVGGPGGAVGDTLPWRRGKRHPRAQRGAAISGNGSVPDPAERAVIRIADERDRVQKKTFTKWVNKHLLKHPCKKAQRHIQDLYEDLRDGHNLISLLEVLSGDTLPRERDVIRRLRLPREKGRMRFHKLQNVQMALDYLRHRQVKLVNIRNDDIADGNPKLTLGLIWTIILHFQISDIQVSGQSEDMTAKEKLLLWAQRAVQPYPGLRCENFSSSWRDGRLFNAIIHSHRPHLVDMGRVQQQSSLQNLEQAFSVAESELGVTRLLDPEDVAVAQPDEKSIITYVSSLYDALPRRDHTDSATDELQLRWQQYYSAVTLLLQWMRHHTALFREHRIPGSHEEVEVLWRQFLRLKETELPAKEADKERARAQFQALESAVQSGRLQVPPGYHPLDVEKEWGELHAALLQREKLLRQECDRLERLQRIVTKLQTEAGLCEEQLNQADALLQAVSGGCRGAAVRGAVCDVMLHGAVRGAAMHGAAIAWGSNCMVRGYTAHGASMHGAMHGAALRGAMWGAVLRGAMHGAMLHGAPHGASMRAAMHGATLRAAMHGATLHGAPHGAPMHGAMHGAALCGAMWGAALHGAMHDVMPHGAVHGAAMHGAAIAWCEGTWCSTWLQQCMKHHMVHQCVVQCMVQYRVVQ